MSATRYFFCILISFTLMSCASMGPGTNPQKKQQILNMKDDSLNKLFAQKPDIQAQINAAQGYAVFSNANINLLFVSAGTGYGVVKDMRTGQHTYMNMAEIGLGLGIGAKDYRIIVVFHTVDAMRYFVQRGWTLGGNADISAKASDKGISLDGETYFGNVTVYTVTESGLALQATLKGVKFWKDKALN